MHKRVMKDLRGEAIAARDGDVGSVTDVYFDDNRWTVRYLVVDTGTWLPGRRVLLSPASLRPGEEDVQGIRADLDRAQVESAPGVELDKPVSRWCEEAHAQHYGHAYYWAGAGLWGYAAVPAAMAAIPTDPAEAAKDDERRAAAEERAKQTHLRSSAEVKGYRIQASDGALGVVDDFVVDDHDWSIAGIVVDTKEWWPGGHVLVAPAEVREIDWESREMHIGLTREQLKNAPEPGQRVEMQVPPGFSRPGFRTDMDLR